MTPPSSSKKVGLGPTGETVRENVARLRGAMQYKELSEKLAAVGRPIHPVGLRRIESGERRVDADDLMALAMVFGVAPNALLLPHFNDDEEIAVTGGSRKYLVWGLWNWANGKGSLEGTPDAEERYWTASKPVNPPNPDQPYLDALDGYFERLRRSTGSTEFDLTPIKNALARLPEDAGAWDRAQVVKNLPTPRIDGAKTGTESDTHGDGPSHGDD